MQHPHPIDLVRRLAQRSAGDAPGPEAICERIPVSVYSDPERFEAERQALFRQRPLIIAHASQIPDAGDALVHDWLGLPVITVRGKDGEIRSFLNVCRHRGMRLVQDQGPTCLRSMVCPYHQWTYGLQGELRNVPRQESFSDLDLEQLALVPVPTEVRDNLVWVQANPGGSMDLDAHLAGLDADLGIFRIADYHFCQQSVRSIQCNWKLVQDAFLDGYHVVRLHKNTVGPFFPDALAETDLIGDHTRSAVARKEIAEAETLPDEALDLRHHCTFSYTVFPNAVLIFHPEYTSIISLFQVSPEETVFVHSMLTPRPPRSDTERDHFQRSFELIDKGVFEAEDIFVSVGAQVGMRSGANEHLLFGALEEAAVRFHRIIDRELAAG